MMYVNIPIHVTPFITKFKKLTTNQVQQKEKLLANSGFAGPQLLQSE